MMKTTKLISIALTLGLSGLWMIEGIANDNITIERRIATQAEDIDNAMAEGLITQDTATRLRSILNEIQGQDMANTSHSEIQDKEINRDLDQSQLEIKSAIAYGK